MRTINTISELRTERTRLRLEREFLEEEINKNVRDIKHMFQPLEVVKRGAGKYLVNHHDGILSESVGQLVNMIGKKLIFRNSGIVTRLLIPYLMKNVTANVVSENKDKILGWLFSFLDKKSKKNGAHKEHFDKGTAHTDY